MNNFRLTALLAATIGFIAAVPQAHAGWYTHKTYLTVSQPIQVANKILPAGTYVFKLADPKDARFIVEVQNSNEDHTFVIAQAIPAFRPIGNNKRMFDYYETAAGEPRILKNWYYPSQDPPSGQDGLQFPRMKITQVSEVQQAAVTPAPVEQAAPEAQAEVEQSTQSEQIAEAPAPAPEATPAPEPAPPTTVAENNVPATIPQTASNLPLLTLLGFGSLVLALGAGVLANRIN